MEVLRVNSIGEFLCRDGRVVKILDEEHWLVPSSRGTIEQQKLYDFTKLPQEVRGWWREVLERTFKTCSLARADGVWLAARWLNRFLQQYEIVTTDFDNLDDTSWGLFAEWLEKEPSIYGRPLAFLSRGLLFSSLKEVARQAILLGHSGVSSITIERLQTVGRRARRGTTAETLKYIEERALTSVQYTDLYAIMEEEWQTYLDNPDVPSAKENLLALVACWLAYNDGLRSAEINQLTVDDVLVDPVQQKHRLRVHTPNKNPDMIPIDDMTLKIVQTLIDEGAETRNTLGTNLLFTSVEGPPRVLTTAHLNYRLRKMVRQHQPTSLPATLRLPDGRTTFGTHLAFTLHNRERVRRIMRHAYAKTTETFYQAQQKLVVAGQMAKALRAEALRLTFACQRPILDISERPEQIDILARNPENTELEWGSCSRDIQRQGACRMAKHCFECPLLVPWASKRHNYVAERDEYLRLADVATNQRDRENRLYHANLAQAYIILIDRRLQENDRNGQPANQIRQRRPRRAGSA